MYTQVYILHTHARHRKHEDRILSGRHGSERHTSNRRTVIFGIHDTAQVIGFILREVGKREKPLLDVLLDRDLTIAQLVLLDFCTEHKER
jgi:hypothetical protein